MSKLDPVGKHFWPRYGLLNFSERVCAAKIDRVCPVVICGPFLFVGRTAMLVHFIWDIFAQCVVFALEHFLAEIWTLAGCGCQASVVGKDD